MEDFSHEVPGSEKQHKQVIKLPILLGTKWSYGSKAPVMLKILEYVQGPNNIVTMLVMAVVRAWDPSTSQLMLHQTYMWLTPNEASFLLFGKRTDFSFRMRLFNDNCQDRNISLNAILREKFDFHGLVLQPSDYLITIPRSRNKYWAKEFIPDPSVFDLTPAEMHEACGGFDRWLNAMPIKLFDIHGEAISGHGVRIASCYPDNVYMRANCLENAKFFENQVQDLAVSCG